MSGCMMEIRLGYTDKSDNYDEHREMIVEDMERWIKQYMEKKYPSVIVWVVG